MSDIKMSEVFDLPFSVEPSGVISDDHCIAIGEFCGTMEQSKAAVHAINNHDNLTQQVAELRAIVIKSVDRLNDCIAQDDAQAYKEAEKFIDIANKAIKESEG